MFAYIECLGDLHGSAEGNNLVRIASVGPGGFSTTTREAFLGAKDVGPDGVTREPTGPAGFIPLPAGSSLTYTDSAWSGTCAVDAASTSCTITATNPTGRDQHQQKLRGDRHHRDDRLTPTRPGGRRATTHPRASRFVVMAGWREIVRGNTSRSQNLSVDSHTMATKTACSHREE
ncbi:MAG: hypothetical protein PHQ28_00215 [Mycobacterium sp.]|nr:hypothetical protein [Mycobacterium sp.]